MIIYGPNTYFCFTCYLARYVEWLLQKWTKRSMRMCFTLAQSTISAGCNFASPDIDCIKDWKTLPAYAQPSTGEAKGQQCYPGPQSLPSPEMVLSENCAQALLSRATVLKYSNKCINKDSPSFLQSTGFSYCKDNEL